MTHPVRRGEVSPHVSVLDGIPDGLPGVVRARWLRERTAQIGWVWSGPEGPLDKFSEEIPEMREALESGDPARILDELGDLFLVLVSLAETLKIDSETALQYACDKLDRRFRAMELILHDLIPEGKDGLWSLAQRTGAWADVKRQEKGL